MVNFNYKQLIINQYMTTKELTDLKSKFVKVSDITVPEQFFQPVPTGNSELDNVFSELNGLIPSQVILVTGNPGSGKTTLCAVAGSKIAKAHNRPVVFLSYEMSDFQLKSQARKIPGFDSLLISTHEFHAEPEGLPKLFHALKSINPALVIVDSLQKMASKMPQGINTGQIKLVQEFTKYAKETFTPVMLIGHNSKGGNYSGPSFLKHEVDSHLIVWYDRETHERLFSMDKNRFGGNMEQYGLRINAEGVFIGSEWWDKVEDRSPADVMDIVMDFKSAGKGMKYANWDKFRDAATSVINYLNEKHADRFAKDTFIGNPKKVSLAWSGRRFCCQYATGKITFGRGFFDSLSESNYKNLGYRSEKPYIQKWVKSKEEACLWAVIHEWVHLFKGYQRHTKAMWVEITRIVNEESWMFKK
jgi:energy-coupling factor transporter ATP-binding protein EcfA2